MSNGSTGRHLNQWFKNKVRSALDGSQPTIQESLVKTGDSAVCFTLDAPDLCHHIRLTSYKLGSGFETIHIHII